MRLRQLENKDAEVMLEWMHDESVVEWLNADFASKTIDDCISFIEYSKKDNENIHLAVVDEMDNYMGTVSLKHVNLEKRNAEFAITIRKSAMGKGYSSYAMNEIIRLGFEDIGLNEIYWCVSPENKRAVKFYEKSVGKRTDLIPDTIISNYRMNMLENLIWYMVSKY